MLKVFLVLLCAVILMACRKKPAPVSVSTPPTSAATAKEPTQEELNTALQVWFTARGGTPGSFEDLVKAGFISKVPTPPPGREYVIDKQTLRVLLK